PEHAGYTPGGVRRLLGVALFTSGVLAAGAFSGTVVADVTTTTATTTAGTTPAPDVLPAGVRVAGVRVGGLSPADAVAAVRAAFARPLEVDVDRVAVKLDPTKVAAAYAA